MGTSTPASSSSASNIFTSPETNLAPGIATHFEPDLNERLPAKEGLFDTVSCFRYRRERAQGSGGFQGGGWGRDGSGERAANVALSDPKGAGTCSA